jgi:peptidoglycan/xylan/chitin deacetylase (PgdA/CDA1 family)/SAM-dependent methyltransferase
VSIIVPAHDAETTLSETLESLQAQTFSAWEAVIVDDGSTDRTPEIAARFAAGDDRLRVVRQANAGESAARNAGWALASHDWLVFLDADDWLLPTYLERMTGAVSADPEAGVVHCGWVRVARDGQQGLDQFAPPDQDVFPELARRNCFAIHACLVRRSLAESIGRFDVTLRTCPDWDLWQRIARTTPRFRSVPEILACYRLRPDSAATHARQLLADALTVISRGHQSDPRVLSPAPRYAQGMPAGLAAKAKLEFVCWAAGLAIGQGQPAEPLLDLVAGQRAEVSTELVAESLFLAIPMPTGHLAGTWGALWPRAETGIDAFLAALEAHVQSPGLAAEGKLLLMRKILTRMLPAFLSRQRSVAGSGDAKTGAESGAVDWEHLASERADLIAEQHRWIAELEAAKAWHDEQRQVWHRRAEAAEQRSGADDERRRFPSGLTRLLGTLRRPAAPAAAPDPHSHRTPPGPFADPRMVEPVSREWGYERGLPVDRYYIERFLARHEQDVQGRVLEIGDNSYTRRFGADRVTTSDVLHVVPGNQNARFVGDLAHADHIPTEAFDCIILTQTLQLIYDLPSALRTVYRVLKPGGVLLATFPGLTRTSQTEWPGSWFWRLTPASARRIFEAAFPAQSLELVSHGNVLTASAFLYGLAVNDLTATELDHEDPDYDVIVTVRAVKPASIVAKGKSDVAVERRSAVNTASGTARALVLLYHRVAASTQDPWQLSVSPDRFEEQMTVLERETAVVNLQVVQEVARGTARPTGRPLVAITFDDGYADNLSDALPRLEKHGLPATVFVCTGPVAHGAEFWWDTLERLLLRPTDLPPTLDIDIQEQSYHWNLHDSADFPERVSREYSDWRAWEPPPTSRHALYVALWQRLQQLDADDRARTLALLQMWAGPDATSQPSCRALRPAELLALAKSSLVDIGAHTINHPALSGLPTERQQAEISGSRTWLEAVVRRPVTSFSYPFGRPVDYTPDTVTAVRQAGFACACSNIAGIVRSGADPFQLPRVQVKNWNGKEFGWQLRQWLAS